MRVLPVNQRALLIELSDLAETQRLFSHLQSDPVEGVTRIVPAARTLLLSFNPIRVEASELARTLYRRHAAPSPERAGSDESEAGARIEIPVYYHGEDLDAVAEMLGIAPSEVIRRHCERDYRVAFCGFAPGFAYLSGGADFEVPRRETPRTRIPEGAVALAGNFSGVYPTDSPGGWQLIGVTPKRMWDINREPAALLQPGMRVRFTPLKAPFEAPEPACTPSEEKTPQAPAVLEVLTPGLQSLFQDLGREGQTHQGVSASGAMDRGALRSANRMVGNPPEAAALEIAQGGLSLYCHRPAIVALSGAELAVTLETAEGERHALAPWQPIELSPGDTLTLGAPTAGVRSYLALRGGFAVTPVLGSCATDTLARLGPAPLARGDRLGAAHLPLTSLALDEAPAFPLPRPGECVSLDIVMGPRSDWFTDRALERLTEQSWQVTPQSNRVGLRLAGETALERAVTDELPSEGTVAGALQVPASGQPVLFLADHPLTGGYPVIACVADHHLDLAGQVPVNATLRFNPLTRFAPLESEHRTSRARNPGRSRHE